MTDGKITTGIVNEVMNHIRRRTYTNRAEFDASQPEILNLQNGLLNVDTLQFEEHSSEHLSLVQSPISYDPKAKCPNILKFLAEVLHPRRHSFKLKQDEYFHWLKEALEAATTATAARATAAKSIN